MVRSRGGSATSFSDYLFLILAPTLISIGQVLVKRAAGSLVTDSAFHFVRSLLASPYFWAALVVYSTSTVLWLFALTRVPLSRAMPFAALTFVIVPIISVLTLGEKLNVLFWVGVAIILTGVYVTVAALRWT